VNEVWFSYVNNGKEENQTYILNFSIKVSKEIVPFQQARERARNLAVWCKNWFYWTPGVG